MLIVGELINSSRKAIQPAIESYDTEAIQSLAVAQKNAGAHYIDVNCGTFVNDEPERLEWLVKTVQAAVDLPLCLDSPRPEALERALPLVKNGQPMINSITGEAQRIAQVLPLLKKYKAKIIALCMDDNGIPSGWEERFAIGKRLVGTLTDAGVPLEDIYLDPLVQPIGTCDQAAKDVLETVAALKKEYPQAHCICGLSNVSFGLPNRKWLNRVFLVQTMTMGMDAYILNPTDQVIMACLYSSYALLGNDSYCGGFLKAHRKGVFENI